MDAAGPLEVRIELPRRLPYGFYHARAFFHAAQATGMGSADFRVRLDDGK